MVDDEINVLEEQTNGVDKKGWASVDGKKSQLMRSLSDDSESEKEKEEAGRVAEVEVLKQKTSGEGEPRGG